MAEVGYVPSRGFATRESLEGSFKGFVVGSSPERRCLMGDAAERIVQRAYSGFVVEVSDRLADQGLVANVVTDLMGAHHAVMLDADDASSG